MPLLAVRPTLPLIKETWWGLPSVVAVVSECVDEYQMSFSMVSMCCVCVCCVRVCVRARACVWCTRDTQTPNTLIATS
jgi:hypothetical protein